MFHSEENDNNNNVDDGHAGHARRGEGAGPLSRNGHQALERNTTQGGLTDPENRWQSFGRAQATLLRLRRQGDNPPARREPVGLGGAVRGTGRCRGAHPFGRAAQPETPQRREAQGD